MSELLTIQFGPVEVLVADCRAGVNEVEVRKSLRLTPPEGLPWRDEPESFGAWLKDALHAEHITTRRAHLVVPREQLVFRRLDLPPTPDDELPAVVGYQSAAASADAGQMLLDYVKLPAASEDTLYVLTVALMREYAGALSHVARAAGLSLEVLTVTSAALAELAVRAQVAQGKSPEERALCLLRHGDRLEIVVVNRHRLLLSHAVEWDGHDRPLDTPRALAEVSRLLVAGSKLLQGEKITRAWVLDEQQDDQLTEALTSRLGCPVQFLPLPNLAGISANMTGGKHAEATEPLAAFANCIGAAYLAVSPTIESVDLLHPRRPAPPQNTNRYRIIAVAAAAVLAIGLGFGWLQMEKGRLDRLIEGRQTTLQDASDFVEMGKPQVASATAVENWQSRQINLLEELGRIRSHLPGTQVLFFTSLRAEPGTGKTPARVRATGLAAQRDVVEQLFSRLAQEGYQVLPRSITRESDNPKYPYKFELVLEISPPPSAARPAPI